MVHRFVPRLHIMMAMIATDRTPDIYSHFYVCISFVRPFARPALDSIIIIIFLHIFGTVFECG